MPTHLFQALGYFISPVKISLEGLRLNKLSAVRMKTDSSCDMNYELRHEL